MMTLHIVKSATGLRAYESLIRSTAAKVIEGVGRLIPLSNTDLVFCDYERFVIPHRGIGAVTFNDHLVLVSIDPSFPNLWQQIAQELPRDIAHELHHCARMRDLGRRNNLLDALVQEGLADHFAEEFTNKPPERWSTAIAGGALRLLWRRAWRECLSTTYDHSAWFFGSKRRHIPRWAGYSIGYQLVQRYLTAHPSAKASKLYRLPSRAFV